MADCSMFQCERRLRCVLFLLSAVFLRYAPFGRYIFAVGGDKAPPA